MADRTHDMSLLIVAIDCITHGFSIDGQALVDLTILGIPGTERAIELFRIDTDQRLADHGETGYFVNTMTFSATKSTARFLAQ